MAEPPSLTGHCRRDDHDQETTMLVNDWIAEYRINSDVHVRLDQLGVSVDPAVTA